MTELFLFQLQFWKKNCINISINVHQKVYLIFYEFYTSIKPGQLVKKNDCITTIR